MVELQFVHPGKGIDCWKVLSLQVSILTERFVLSRLWTKKNWEKIHLIAINLQKSRISPFHQITSPAMAEAHRKNQRRPHVGIEDRTPFPEVQSGPCGRLSHLKIVEKPWETRENPVKCTVHHHANLGISNLWFSGVAIYDILGWAYV